jgi:hypothetical protein
VTYKGSNKFLETFPGNLPPGISLIETKHITMFGVDELQKFDMKVVVGVSCD